MQSQWYTDLFQSGRSPWSNPYNYIWKAYQDMSEWFKNLPSNVPPQIKEFLELDLLYSYVYILSPSPRCPVPSEHAQRLIVEHCSAYAKMVQRILAEPIAPNNPSPFSFYDALRAYMMARDVVDALSSNLDTMLQPPTREPSYSPRSSRDHDSDPLAPVAFPPPIPAKIGNDSSQNPVTRALDIINTFLAILSSFGVRFGYVSGVPWRDKFQLEAQPLVNRLQARLQVQQPNPVEPYFWATTGGPITPQTAAVTTSPPPQLGSSFYPSPPTTQYSPSFVPQDMDCATASNGSSWANSSPEARDQRQLSTSTLSLQSFVNTPSFVNEFGIGSTAAWDTLPGGTMNARFS
jgi:hypothetical protein